MSFLGAKSASGAYQAIIAAMPPHDVYIETHLGTGAVLRHKPPAARTIAIERDPEVLAAFEPPYPVELVCGDCDEYLQAFDFGAAGRVLVYDDPPYLLTTRTSRRRYRYDYTIADHRRLLDRDRRLPAAVMISGYPSALYDDALPGWRTLEFQVMSRGGVRTEKLWMNYPANAVHWATFAGSNFTDRQRIKRKAMRWATNYRDLPPAERLAVLSAVLQAEAELQGGVDDIDGDDEALIDGRGHGRRQLWRPRRELA
jgi:DNA adenine methylase